MPEYIEREALLAAYDREHVGPPGRARTLIADAPSVDVVPRSLYEQACAVRDIAVEQLRSIGKDVGDSMEDVMYGTDMKGGDTNGDT